MIRALAFAFCVLALAGCSADPNEAANRLFVEAQQLIEKAERQGPGDRLRSLSEAEEKLNSIITKFPSANLAVQLASGQSVGKISLKSTSTLRARAQWNECLRMPRRPCVLAEAFMAAQAVEGERDRVSALVSVARTQGKVGLSKDAAITLAQAREAAQSIKSDESRAYELASVAAALAATGATSEAAAVLEQALQVTNSLSKEGERAFALTAIVRAQADRGKIDEALKTAQSISDESRRISALLAVAEAQLAAGRPKDAIPTIEQATQVGRMTTTEWSIPALVAIGDLQSRSGLEKEARETFDRAFEASKAMTNAFLRPAVLAGIARGWANSGRLPEALQLALSIDDEWRRATALAAIAEAQARAGLSTDATATFDNAIRTARALSKDNQPFAFRAIIAAQAKSGRTADALSLSESLIGERSAWNRAGALNAIAEALPN